VLRNNTELWMCSFLLSGMFMVAGPTPAARAAESFTSYRLPDDVPPVMAVWGWLKPAFKPANYKAHIDMVARHSGVNILATTLRAPGKLITDQGVHDKIKDATRYASPFGIRIAMDLDVRLAREAFQQVYPDELQEMLRLREVALKGSDAVIFSIPSEKLRDHYTFQSGYIHQAGRLVRVYVYERGPNGIEPETVQDITERCTVTAATAEAVAVSIPCGRHTEGKTACVMASFTHLTPAVFAPHLLSYQRQIIERYRDVPLAGACKDEWGFPPCYDGNPAHNDYWYSRFLAEAYSE